MQWSGALVEDRPGTFDLLPDRRHAGDDSALVTSNWICDACHSFNDPRVSACYKCRVKRGQAVPQAVIPGATPGPSVSAAIGGPGVAARDGSSVVAALIVGAVAAIGCIAAWYWLEAGIRLFQGRLAWTVGVVIAFAVIFAGTLGGGRRVSFMIPVIAVVLTVVTIAVGEYLIISSGLAATSTTAIPAGTIPVAPIGAVLDSAGSYLSSDPLRPILWVLAISAAWLIPWGVLVGSGDREP
jgi:hypothetical protein